jgi:hypothetical protein
MNIRTGSARPGFSKTPGVGPVSGTAKRHFAHFCPWGMSGTDKRHFSSLCLHVVPDFFCFETKEENARFILPWERFRLNPAESRVSRAENITDHQFERTLWDEPLFSFVREGDGIAAGHIDKGEMAISLGFTHVVTVNVEEAILISSQYPELRVAWWDGERKFMIQSKAV